MKKLLFILLAVLSSPVVSYAGGAVPGTCVSEAEIREKGIGSFFGCQPVPDGIFTLMQGKSYKSDCTIPREELSYVYCLHRDIHGRILAGELVVSRRIAPKIVSIMRKLYDASYPIEKMRLVDYWNADDESSMSANNSSAFNFRFISHTDKVSVHGKGLAIDINPLYNPYFKVLKDGRKVVEPSSAVPYLDRTRNFPYKIERGDLCCTLFLEAGFEWGGDWKSCKDYQHFEYKER